MPCHSSKAHFVPKRKGKQDECVVNKNAAQYGINAATDGVASPASCVAISYVEEISNKKIPFTAILSTKRWWLHSGAVGSVGGTNDLPQFCATAMAESRGRTRYDTSASVIQTFQSHTVLRNCSNFTFLDFISMIQGCSSMRHGVARRRGSFSRLLLRQA